METVRKIWSSYAVKLILALGLAILLSRISGINFLGGVILVCFMIFYLFRAAKDPALQKKKPAARTFIYIILVMLLLAGLIIMSSSPDPASQSIRSHISSSVTQ